ncbi:unnamed protein product [Brachionus calyciflorus]|uniref:Transmembrane protein 70 n=1 Tax=Brachionus calyciflorus TaxID=104777 RepID=A0A814RBC2_9BILA|nr:unnamed protein product [Brachionus calyciflorus]
MSLLYKCLNGGMRSPKSQIKLFLKALEKSSFQPAITLNRNISLKRIDLNQNNNNLNRNDDDEEDRRIRMELTSSKVKKYLEEEKKYNGKLVYVGSLTRQLKSAKFLSLSSSLFGVMLMPFLTDTLSASSLFAQIFVFGTTGFFIFVTPMFSQFLGRRYVTRMYYNYEEKKCTAIMLSFFMYEYKLEFPLSPFSTVKLKNKDQRSLFVDLQQVHDVQLVEKIYGYDKPFDFKKYSDKDNDD